MLFQYDAYYASHKAPDLVGERSAELARSFMRKYNMRVEYGGFQKGWRIFLARKKVPCDRILVTYQTDWDWEYDRFNLGHPKNERDKKVTKLIEDCLASSVFENDNCVYFW